MKNSFLVLSIFFIVGLQAKANSPSLQDLTEEARKVLAQAAENDSTLAPYFLKISKALNTDIQLIQKSHPLWSLCETRDAFYLKKEHQIFVCPEFLGQRKDFMVQKLIHEFAHAAGFLDECNATRLEFFAMESAKRRPGPLSYECGL